MKLMLITNDPTVAASAATAGVDRLFVDLEIIGKVERQGHLSTVISRHSIEDVAKVRAAVPERQLLVRVNPFHNRTEEEVERVLECGADMLMLPMFVDAWTVSRFSNIVRGRAEIVALVETPSAVKQIRHVVEVPGITEIFVGLNDLHLSLGRTFMFELLTDGMVESISQCVLDAGLKFGFGGIARVGEGLVPAQLILGEHVRLGSSSVILSRTFFQDASRTASAADFPDAIAAIRAELQGIRAWLPERFEDNRQQLVKATQTIVEQRLRRAA